MAFWKSLACLIFIALMAIAALGELIGDFIVATVVVVGGFAILVIAELRKQ